MKDGRSPVATPMHARRRHRVAMLAAAAVAAMATLGTGAAEQGTKSEAPSDSKPTRGEATSIETPRANPGTVTLLGLRRVTLFVGDAERSLRFYRDFLGLRVRHDGPLPAARLRESLRLPASATVRFVQLEPPGAGQPLVGLLEIRDGVRSVSAERSSTLPSAILVWQVRGLERTLDQARRLGFEVEGEPATLSGSTGVRGREATVLDPDGVRIILQELTTS